MTLKTQLGLEVKEDTDALAQSCNTAKSYKAELANLNCQIEETRATLTNSATLAYETAKENFTRTASEEEECTKKIDDLYAKQIGGQNFDTKEDRDAFLQTQTTELNNTLGDKKTALKEQKKLLFTLTKKLSNDQNTLEKKLDDTEHKNVLFQEITATLAAKKT